MFQASVCKLRRLSRAPFRRGLVAALTLILTLSSTLAATPLAESGRIEGAITDPSGAAVTAARVTLRNRVGGVAAQTTTDREGRFVVRVLPGSYRLVVEARGFSQAERADVEVVADETKTVDVALVVVALSDQMVVSATRTATPADEIAGAVEVIGGEVLAQKSQSQVSEALRLVPGLVVAQSGGRGSITSIFTRGGESNYTKVMIDGVPVNAAGGAFDFAFLTPENVERVEVSRGPGSAPFGSDAMTGIVQLFTRRGATRTPELELSGEGGSFAHHRETATLSGVHGGFDYAASYGYQKTDGRFRNSDFLNRSASVNLGLALAPQANLRLVSRLTNSTLGVPGATGVLFADPDQRQKHRDVSLAATLDVRTTSRWYQTARFIYAEFDNNSFDPVAQDLSQPDTPPLAPGSFGNDFASRFGEHQKRTGVHYQTVAVLNLSNVLTAGVDFEREAAVFTDDFSRVTPERDNLGLYVQDQFSWRERLFVTAGVRLERNSGRTPEDLRAALASLGSSAPLGDVGFGVEANPKIAAAVLARQHREDGLGATRLKASFGASIKEPTLTEAFSPSIFFLGNPSLKPERAVSFDVGVIQEFANRRASLEATYFDNRFRDQIIFTFDPVTFGAVRLPDGRLTNFINLERASARGVELIASARPLLKLRATASYTFLRSRLERAELANREVGLALLRRPRHSGTFDVMWVEEKFDVSLDGSLVGERRDIDPLSGARFRNEHPIVNDGYAKVNLAGSYRFGSRVTAFARLENLLNQEYEEVLGFPANKLNFRAGLRLRLGGGR